MAVSLASVEKALKQLYLGAIIEEMNTDIDPFSAKIERSTENIVGNNGIIRSAQIGLNGGFGAGTETGTLPAAGENVYQTLKSTTKNLYGVISVSDKALKSIRGNDKGSFANLIEREIQSMITTAKWHFARQIYGTSLGKLCNITDNASGSTKLGVDDVSRLMEGMRIGVYTSVGGQKGSNVRIKAVDRNAMEITVDSSITVGTGGNCLAVVQGSLNLEMTGLEDIFDTKLTNLYGLARKDYPWLNPYLHEKAGPLDQGMLQDAISRQEDAYNVHINYISCGSKAFISYLKLLKQESRQVNTTRLAGGATALTFNGIDVVRNKFTPTDAMDLLDTTKFCIDQVGEWDWIEGPTRSIFVQNGSTPVYNATLVKYADLMCVTPGGMARISGIKDPDYVEPSEAV